MRSLFSQPSIDLLAMWFDSRRDGTADVCKLFLCMLPPEEFTKFGYKYQIDQEALLNRIKVESIHPSFSKLNQDSFDLNGHMKLPCCRFEAGEQYESWHNFLENSESGDRKLLSQHLRTLAAGINQSLEETHRLFWKLRVDEAFRADAYRKICQYLHRSSVDKVRFFIGQSD
jgi:hypothetical protein